MISIVGFGRPKYGATKTASTTAAPAKKSQNKAKTCPSCGQNIK
jgi:hypothetical protein